MSTGTASYLLYTFDTGAGQKARSRPRPIMNPEITPFEMGGWLCSACLNLIGLDDRLGYIEGNVFRVFGYRCPHCNHSWISPAYRARKRPQKTGPSRFRSSRLGPAAHRQITGFDWKLLPVTNLRRGTPRIEE